MGAKWHYYTEGSFPVDFISALVQRIENSGLTSFLAKNVCSGYAELHPEGRLPSLEGLAGIKFTRIPTSGWLDPKHEPFAVLKRILEKTHNTIGQIGMISVSVGFEEKTSKQTKSVCDMCAVWIFKGEPHFKYVSERNSNVQLDLQHRKSTIGKLIHLAEIPAHIEDRGNEFVVIYEDGSGAIDRNPHSLTYQYKSKSPAQLVDLMEKCVSELSTRKPCYYYWCAAPEWKDSETDIGKRIYDYAAAANLPAKSYQVDLSNFLLSSFDGLEALRKLCGPKDEIDTELGSIDLPEQSYANIYIITTAAGHCLELEASYPPDLDDLAAKLGVRFVPKSRLKRK